MPSLTIEYEDDSERLLIEQALAMVADLRRTALEAPHGTVLAACEAEAVEKGRKLTVSALEDAPRRRVAEVDAPKNGRPGRGRRGGDRVGS
ncbi:hypothetical protein [Paludisphaera soli]|uniref:hypothetical protein n=1 Tax=Paludisphaera soli TaxID=2712865 RepID=UPI0013EB0E82|nr:hypothetical protein [Paludisphaera soli]